MTEWSSCVICLCCALADFDGSQGPTTVQNKAKTLIFEFAISKIGWGYVVLLDIPAISWQKLETAEKTLGVCLTAQKAGISAKSPDLQALPSPATVSYGHGSLIFGFSMSKMRGDALSHMTYLQYHDPKTAKKPPTLRGGVALIGGAHQGPHAVGWCL